MKTLKPKIIAVVGPTASGKTSYSIELAKKIDGEIISADSRLVYKGFDIGTAKPTTEEQNQIKHHMIDIVEPEFDYSVSLYAEQARIAIDDILSRGKTPIITGGTGLYHRVLLDNYDLPKVEPDYALREELKLIEGEVLHKMLSEIDVQTALQIEINDKKKLIRALEVVKTLGKPMSDVRGVKEPEFEVEWLGLNHPREILYERINERVDLMIENGLIEETQKLLKKNGRIGNLLYTIGYQEVISFLDGTVSLEDAKEKLKQNTRRYAKRQLTWFRKNPEIKWNIYPERM